MPAVAIGDFRIFVRMDHKHGRITVQRWCCRMHVQRSEAFCKGNLDVGWQFILIAKKQHLMIGEGSADPGEGSVAERREIGADNFGAEDG